jgi:hydroxyethylthiazole kinase
MREAAPLVHNMTNYVVMNFTANALLAAGASPVMSHAADEVEDMVSVAKALVLNIGTLDDIWVYAMLLAGKKATELGLPIVLDPVGAGATPLRTNAARRILDEMKVAVVRANPSEILAVAGTINHTKGVDSADSVEMAAEAARRLAAETGAVVAMTGAEDLVTDGVRTVRVANGHPLMGCVTGTGCGATAMVGAFTGASPDAFSSAAAALAYYGAAGEQAAREAAGPGTFVPLFLDALHRLSPEDLEREARIRAE